MTQFTTLSSRAGSRQKWNFADGGAIAHIDKDSFDQVGCIHTTQGLEFDYVGINIGNDMIRKRAYRD
ncbi:MAG: DUF2075 domain-containing protein [Bacillus subtilis]|nr:DUF2075 domain-containing protein [Bacillus subtilis]